MSTSATPQRDSTAADLATRFAAVRAFTNTLCETLTAEDCCLQSMPSASPTRWHLAHTTWFFETFLLKTDPVYHVFDEHYEVLFNSYYNSVGEQFPRARRGLLSRPSLADVQAYRRHVDAIVSVWLSAGRVAEDAKLANIVEWGLHHEQQHQELILTDVKHLFSLNPKFPVFRQPTNTDPSDATPLTWIDYDGGVQEIGHSGSGFAYDNELPRHRVYLEPFRLASRPVTSGEYLEFIHDGGYERPELWLSEGWNGVRESNLKRPIYWFDRDRQWLEFTLAGLLPLDLAAPVCHVSYFEADAYARWAGVRLPSEAEWEITAAEVRPVGNFVDALLEGGHAIHPRTTKLRGAHPDQPQQMFGDVWEWTASPYTAYPGYTPPSGALGEYNGKFMCNQYVLRGGSCATHSSHIRPTYRNFFPAATRWQFSGIRLAE